MTPVPVGYLVKRLQDLVHEGLAGALRPHGLTVAQYAALAALDEEPGLSNAELARRAFVTAQSMNRVVLELEEAGLVRREPDPSHGRVLRAAVAPRGAKVLRAVAPAVESLEMDMLRTLSPRARDSLRESLLACVENLESPRRS